MIYTVSMMNHVMDAIETAAPIGLALVGIAAILLAFVAAMMVLGGAA